MLKFLWAVALGTVSAISREDLVFRGNCETNSIPYKFSVNKEGSAELSCATPSCLGDDYSKDPSAPLRKRRHSHKDFEVTCSNSYSETVCTKEDEWTGGLLEVSNGTHVTLKTKCCKYPGLKHSEYVKTIFLHVGEEFSGGFFAKDSDVGGFDLVKEVRKQVERKRVRYVVTVHRIPCVVDIDSHEMLDSMHSNETSGSESGEEEMQLSRSKRRLYGAYREDKDYGLLPSRYYRRPATARAAPTRRRRPIGLRRRNMRRYMDDYYYDYEDEDYYQPRNRIRNPSRKVNGGALWPFAVEMPRGRQFGEETQESNALYNTENMVLVDSGSTGIQQLLVNPPSSSPVKPPMRAAMAGSKYPEIPPIQMIDSGSPPQQLAPPDTAVITYQQLPTANNYVAPPAPQPDPNSYLTNQYAQPHVQEAETPLIQNQQPQPPVQQQQQQIYQPQQPQQPQPPAYQYNQQPSYSYNPSSYSQYAPYAGPNLNSLFSQMQCFTGSDTVETQDGNKKIKDLEIGDMVLSMDENMVTFSPVIMFLHRIENENASFIEIETNESVLKITEFHLIYKSSCGSNAPLRLVPAKEVRENDCVYVLNDGRGVVPEKVTRVGKVYEEGIYAPLTSSGDIFVNGMLASCHSNLALKTLQQTFFSTYRGITSFFRQYLPASAAQQELPYGVSYLTSVIDLFIPSSYV